VHLEYFSRNLTLIVKTVAAKITRPDGGPDDVMNAHRSLYSVLVINKSNKDGKNQP
jgi:hypothetical protein